MHTGGGEWLGGAKFDIVQHTRGQGIDIGRGPLKAFPHFVGVREVGDETCKGHHVDVPVESFDDLSDFKDGSLDFVFVHGIELTAALYDACSRVLREGGNLLSLRDDKLVRYVLKGGAFEFAPIDASFAIGKRVCVVRYGAIGDTLQAAALFPQLKRDGYHITVMCEESGRDILRTDPHVDAFLIQDKDQVPNSWLPLYWMQMEKRFDKWINLCESVEGSLLALPGRALHQFPKQLRHEICNKNYLEFMAKIGETTFSPHHFYPTADDTAAAEALVARRREEQNKKRKPLERNVDPFLIMVALAGSSVHKFYPHMDSVIARILLEIPTAQIFMVGDVACKLLEQGWQNEPRVACLSGELSLRTTLTLAQHCHLVIGPETGVMNAVAFETNAKIVLLSHSTEENLTKHWVNTEALASTETPCYPCHQMHTSHMFCPEDVQTGSAMCQFNLTPERVWRAVQAAYVGRKTVESLIKVAA